MEQTELEMIAELIELTEELGVLAARESEIRERLGKLLGLLSLDLELRDGGTQPVKVKPPAKPRSPAKRPRK